MLFSHAGLEPATSDQLTDALILLQHWANVHVLLNAFEFPQAVCNFFLKKTKISGTPPRLDAKTIDYSVCLTQAGDDRPIPFSFMNDEVWIKVSALYPIYSVLYLQISPTDFFITIHSFDIFINFPSLRISCCATWLIRIRQLTASSWTTCTSIGTFLKRSTALGIVHLLNRKSSGNFVVIFVLAMVKKTAIIQKSYSFIDCL